MLPPGPAHDILRIGIEQAAAPQPVEQIVDRVQVDFGAQSSPMARPSLRVISDTGLKIAGDQDVVGDRSRVGAGDPDRAGAIMEQSPGRAAEQEPPHRPHVAHADDDHVMPQGLRIKICVLQHAEKVFGFEGGDHSFSFGSARDCFVLA